MDHFNYRNGELYAEDVPLERIALQFGTPCYVYSRATIERHWHAFDQAFAGMRHLVCYAVKANSNIALLNLLVRLGSGFDIVSGGELQRVLHAGGSPDRIVFSGVGKTVAEIRLALEAEIRCFNVESASELVRINETAISMNRVAPVSIRVNPDVDAKTHPYISTGLKENKFGIHVDNAVELYKQARDLPGLRVEGIDCHIGSQLTSLEPFLDALDRVLNLIDRLAEQEIHIRHLDLGGGLGIRYQDEQPPEPSAYAEALATRLNQRDLEIMIEPGRAIMGNAGVLLTRVEYLKKTPDKNFAIVDAAMNDLLRPALYGAWQEILPLKDGGYADELEWDIVGPVCETGDFLGKDRKLGLKEEALLAVRSSGAYGFTMSSNYNSRPRAAEVLVDQEREYLVRDREEFKTLIQGEHMLPDSAL